MPEYSTEELNKRVSEITAQVMREVGAGETQAFKVDDLAVKLKDLGPGSSAWTISYSTAAGIRDVSLADRLAWTISYSTAAGIREIGSIREASSGA